MRAATAARSPCPARIGGVDAALDGAGIALSRP
jgi:hypothetical protein